MPLRVVFFGSPEFALPSLRAIHADDRFAIVLVVTQPNRVGGRGRRVIEPPVKSVATELGLEVLQPVTLRSDDAELQLSEVEPHLFVVVAYGEILRRSVLQIPTHGCLNVHPSLLPKYRGSSPIQAAILNGDHSTGVSIIQMARRLDSGPILAQRELMLNGSETGASLSVALANLAGLMLPDVAVAWCAGQILSTPQDETQVSVTRELTKADGQIDWRRPAVQIERQVRAYEPWPAAWTTIEGRRLVIHQAARGPNDLAAAPGTILTVGGSVVVTCGHGSLRLIDVQPEGKQPMTAPAWLRGSQADHQPRFDLIDPAPHSPEE